MTILHILHDCIAHTDRIHTRDERYLTQWLKYTYCAQYNDSQQEYITHDFITPLASFVKERLLSSRYTTNVFSKTTSLVHTGTWRVTPKGTWPLHVGTWLIHMGTWLIPYRLHLCQDVGLLRVCRHYSCVCSCTREPCICVHICQYVYISVRYECMNEYYIHTHTRTAVSTYIYI